PFLYSWKLTTREYGIAPAKGGQFAAKRRELFDKVKMPATITVSMLGGALRLGLGRHALAASERDHVDHLDGGGKRHGEVDVAAWDVEMHPVGDQGRPDQEQKG